MNFVICIDGGAGRVFTSIPALEKFVRNHQNDQVIILVNGWTDLFLGNSLLEDLVYPSESNLSTNLVLNADELIIPEPYHHIEYIKGNLSLSQSFDFLINGSCEPPEKYLPSFYSSKEEEISAMDVIKIVKEKTGKEKVIVIQPFGSSARQTDHKAIIDVTNRSMELLTYYHLVDSLKENFALVYMGDFETGESVTAKPKVDYRTWYSIINEADYFIGVDSLGQHYAFSSQKPGTILIGGTNPTNVSYPEHFNFFAKPSIKIKYSPIRLFHRGSYVADISNDKNMLYTKEDMENMMNSIYQNIECVFKENKKYDEKKSNCSCN